MLTWCRRTSMRVSDISNSGFERLVVPSLTLRPSPCPASSRSETTEKFSREQPLPALHPQLLPRTGAPLDRREPGGRQHRLARCAIKRRPSIETRTVSSSSPFGGRAELPLY